jgi:cell volume regulation protein A
MHHDGELILLAGALMGAGILAAFVADRVRIPGLLLFLGLGMLAGSEGIGGIDFSDAELARTLGTIGLVLILFEGGLTAGWGEIRPVLGTAISLATIGTLVTALIAGLAAKWLIGLGTLESMIVGSAIAATDSAAIFSVLRGSNLKKQVARSLEGESGMNDPVALLLVVGFIDWIQQPSYGALDMAGLFLVKLILGAGIGLGIGWIARRAFLRLDPSTPGTYPVASIATAGITYGLSEVLGGSGLLSVYFTALTLGTGEIPGRQTAATFHQGLGWVSQITLFFMLGLLVFPGDLADLAIEGLLLSAVLILVARPAAAVAATVFSPFDMRERLMLGWAGLRGAAPIWLATFPVVAGVAAGERLFDLVFFVVITSTLIQGASFEPLARRLRLTTQEPALPRRLHESGRIRELGGDVVVHRVLPGAAIDGHMVRELELPREALVNVVVRGGRAIPPRGSTEVRAGDELHVLVRSDLRDDVDELTRRWHEGPIGEAAPARRPLRGAPQVFTVHPARDLDDPANPKQVDGIDVLARLRSRRDRPGALVSLVDGRHAVTGSDLVAIGSRATLGRWCARRGQRPGADQVERSWWQEIAGALSAPSPDPGP